MFYILYYFSQNESHFKRYLCIACCRKEVPKQNTFTIISNYFLLNTWIYMIQRIILNYVVSISNLNIYLWN